MPTPTPAERVASEIARVTGNVADAYTSCNTMGATMPAAADQDSDHLPATILTIPQSSPSPTPQVEKKAVNLIDIDGTLLYSYTKTEAQALTELPSTGGTHTGLTFDGWNWQLSSIKSYLTNHPDASFNVMAQYAIPNNETRFYITIPTNQYLTVPLYFSGAITIDWGDGTTGTASSSTSHTYSPSSYPADFVIKCRPADSSSITWGTQTPGTILGNSEVYMSMLKKIELGCGEIRQYGLQNYRSLRSILYSSNLSNRQTTSSGGIQVFINCHSLERVALSRAIVSISNGTFTDAHCLNDVVIPDSVTSINETSFSNCRGMTSISIPDSVASIGKAAFAYCYGLEEFRFPSTITTINQTMFQNCTALKYVEIPHSVTSIGNYVFFGCDSMQEIEIPDRVTSIGTSAFNTCRSLAAIVIPASVTTISGSAFADCMSLAFVDLSKFDGTIPSVGTGVFPSFTKLGAKNSSMMSSFIADTNWNTYSSQFFVKSW